MNSYSMITEPVIYGKLKLKNRIIFAPTTMGLKEDEYIEKIRQIAAGGCAMIIIGDVPAAKSHMGFSLFSKNGFKHYQKITETAHRYGCKVSAQLHQNDTNFKGMFKYIPSLLTKKVTQMELRSLLNKETADYISNLPKEKVKSITSSFGDAALKAKEAGFDMVQIHGDRMCGSFSSASMNHRTDEYGGNALNRTRFATECIQAVRKCLPDFPIDYKLAVRQEDPHYGNAGVLTDELGIFVPALQKAGVQSFHVALADHGKLEDTIPPANHPYFKGQGCFLKFCDMVRKYTDLPICAVGGLSDPDFIEAQLESGRMTCCAMSRQLIADPEWVNKIINNEAGSIHRCIRCNKECLGGMYQHKGVHCIYERKK